MSTQPKEEQEKPTCSPLQEWMNIYMQFIENISYLKAEDYRKSPEKFIELQLKLAAENTAKFQDYLRQSWSLFEKMITQSNPQAVNFLNKIPETPTFDVSDNLMGRISNSIFTPTYWSLNPFEMVKIFASDMTSDLTSKIPKAQTNRTNKSKPKRKTSTHKKE